MDSTFCAIVLLRHAVRQNSNTHCVVGGKLGLSENRIQRGNYFPKHGVGGHTPGKNNPKTGIFLLRLYSCRIDCLCHTAKGIRRCFGRHTTGAMELLHLILHTGKGELAVITFDLKTGSAFRFAAQGIQMLS